MTTKKENSHLGKEIITSGETNPLWFSDFNPASYNGLEQDIAVENLVIGGGISGLTTAYFLAKSGKSVAVVDDGFLGSGETGRTTAHITYALSSRYYELEKLHGENKSKAAALSNWHAINQIDEIITSEKIRCDFVRLNGYLFSSRNNEQNLFKKELEILNKYGLGVKMLTEAGTNPFNPKNCLLFPDQAQFHPLKYLDGLAKAVKKYGGQIFTRTKIESFENGLAKTGNNHNISYANLVMAVYSPFNVRFKMHTKQAPYRTYVIVIRIPKGSVTKALYWDNGYGPEGMAEPYHYVRIQNFNNSHDHLIIGGEDHKTGQAFDMQDRYRFLERWARENFNSAEEVIYRWSGQILEPIDQLAYMGLIPGKKNIYVITGQSGNGMTFSTIGAKIISDLINGNPNDWSETYEPTRKSIFAAKEFFKENLNVAVQYKDKLVHKVIRTEEIAPGEGAVMNKGNSHIAVFKDDNGIVHSYKAVCPHLKCIVRWNPGEKSFDCPCHGSRFSAHGKLITGPANSDLEKIEKELAD